MQNIPLFAKVQLNHETLSEEFFNIYLRLHNGNGCQVKVKPTERLSHALGSCALKQLGLSDDFRAFFQSR